MLLAVAVMDACLFFFFFFNDTATTEIYTLSLHDALPISIHDIIIMVIKNYKDAPGDVNIEREKDFFSF